MVAHYIDGNPTPAWLAAMLELEVEGERTPIQDEPREPQDERLSMFHKRQAA